MKYNLSLLCEYRKGKVSVDGLNKDTYISTENMLPNKGGVIRATSLPTTSQTQEYKKGDVLVSNIRPYFKKIWQAEYDGGCSNDVLVFKANENTDKDFLYYVLADDAFFNYSMATSKGTKMPRGDKTSIMQYGVPHYDIVEQKKIACVLRLLDKKIEFNNKINNNLEQQAQTLFTAWFENFEPFGGVAPYSWKQVTLGDIAEIKTNSFNPQKNLDVQIEHYSIPAFDEKKYPVFESASDIKSNKYILTNNSVMASKLNPDTKRVWRPLCMTDLAVSSTEFIIFEPFNPVYKDYVYSIIDSKGFTDWMCSHTTGSTNSRQRTAPGATLNYLIWLPDQDAMDNFLSTVTPMYDLIAHNLSQNQELISLRDSLLPKLMSGELDVSNIDL